MPIMSEKIRNLQQRNVNLIRHISKNSKIETVSETDKLTEQT